MASNFKISVRRNNETLSIKLAGDFDGSSACELLNLLKTGHQGVRKVLVNTTGLKEIHAFGQDTFQNNLYTLKDQPIRLIFTGKNSAHIAPEHRKFSGSLWSLGSS
jgi:hypothetical protein